MGIAGILFSCWRVMQIVTLIPTVGMLSYFVNGFVSSNQRKYSDGPPALGRG